MNPAREVKNERFCGPEGKTANGGFEDAKQGLGRIGIFMHLTACKLLQVIFAILVTTQNGFCIDDQNILDLKPAVWLDANAPQTVQLNEAGHLVLWADRSGNGNDAIPRQDHQPDTWPALDEKATRVGAKAFYCGSGYMLLKTALFADTLELFCVFCPRHYDEVGAIFGGESEAGGIEFRVGPSSSTTVPAGTGSDSSDCVLSITKQNIQDVLRGRRPIPNDRFSLVSFTYKTGEPPNVVFRINGVPEVSGNYSGHFDEGIKSIGYALGTDESFKGWMAEIIGFTHRLSPEEIRKVEDYLLQKYQIPSQSCILTHPPQDHSRLNEALTTISQYVVQHPTDIALVVVAVLLALTVFLASRPATMSDTRRNVLTVFLGLAAAAIGSVIPGIASTTLDPDNQFKVRASGAIVLFFVVLFWSLLLKKPVKQAKPKPVAARRAPEPDGAK